MRQTNRLPMHLRGVAAGVAKHEAGHYVVARVNGFATPGFSATMFNASGAFLGGNETTIARPLRSLDQTQRYLEQRIQILYAGALAESLSQTGDIDYNAAVDCLQNRGGKDDYTKVRELLNLLGNLKYPSDATLLEMQTKLSAVELEVWNTSADIVKAERLIIEGLAGLLTEKLMQSTFNTLVTLSASEIDTLPGVIARFGSQ
jgi:hypothetical protein